MTLLQEMISYLVSAGLAIGDGIDAFRDFVPEDPSDIVVLYEYKGDPISVYDIAINRSVQVLVRGSTAELARNKVVAICSAFISPKEDNRIDFSSTCWGQVYVRQSPFKLEQDEQDRVTYCFNLGITTNNKE